MSGTKPVIFISYAHADEHTPGETAWLSYVREHLQPAVKHGIFDLWEDRQMPGGTEWNAEIEAKLRACDIFILLVSRRSMKSNYIIDREIAIIQERIDSGETVHCYPLLLTPTSKAGLRKVEHWNLRPRDAKPLSGFSDHARDEHMVAAADEIEEIAAGVVSSKLGSPSAVETPKDVDVHIAGLPETPYEHLVGRDDELKQLDDAWDGDAVNILSLIADGGAGKSALVNEWLTRMQADGYRKAEAVLGWSFYSQGTKERATSAEGFLEWAVRRLGLAVATTSSAAKGEAIAEALMRGRVLLLLDGVEPLQHGPGPQLGQLKDLGLRALLRRFAATSPGEAHGLIVITSRLAITDIARWKDSAAPLVEVGHLSDQAGAALLRDNGVWGTDSEREVASSEFDGHPLALGLLASYLKEKHRGDVRRRDQVGALLADAENPAHGHAQRVMRSYETEWLANQPVLLAVMHIIGLFDRPASEDCLRALRNEPVIEGLTDQIVGKDDGEWNRSVARLREVRLLSPPEEDIPGSLDAHALVREWFGERLRHVRKDAWKSAHGRLYEHLRDTTSEGETPTLENLAPLYQAIAHGCRADCHQEVLDGVLADRIYRRTHDHKSRNYAGQNLGAYGSNLSVFGWFFEAPYETPITTLTEADQAWVLAEAAFCLRAQGRLAEALPAQRSALAMREKAEDWVNAAISAGNMCISELLVGQIQAAVETASTGVQHADRSGDAFWMLARRADQAHALCESGRLVEAAELFADSELRQRKLQPNVPYLYSMRGYWYCDFLLNGRNWLEVQNRAKVTLQLAQGHGLGLLSISLDTLALGRSRLGLELDQTSDAPGRFEHYNRSSGDWLGAAIDGLRVSGQVIFAARGLLARAVFCRSIGDWGGAQRDLEEVEEISELAPMKLYLCDMALERARVALARVEAFAPLNELIEDSPPPPEVPDAATSEALRAEAAKQVAMAADYIETCGYHRRDEELAELQAVLRGEKKFAELPPRV